MQRAASLVALATSAASLHGAGAANPSLSIADIVARCAAEVAAADPPAEQDAHVNPLVDIPFESKDQQDEMIHFMKQDRIGHDLTSVFNSERRQIVIGSRDANGALEMLALGKFSLDRPRQGVTAFDFHGIRVVEALRSRGRGETLFLTFQVRMLQKAHDLGGIQKVKLHLPSGATGTGYCHTNIHALRLYSKIKGVVVTLNGNTLDSAAIVWVCAAQLSRSDDAKLGASGRA